MSITKRSPRIRFEFVSAQKQSTLGGLPALEALAQQFDLWRKIRALPGLDPRRRTSHGSSPELIVAQLLYSFCSGGASLADAERLNDEPLARQLARVEKFADQTQLGEWLRQQSDASIAALWKLIAQFVQWVIARADAARWTHAGRAEAFFDDTQIEVFGPSFEGAQLNYAGQRALSWQTLWFGPFLVDGQLGSPGDVSSALPSVLQEHRGLWQKRPCNFLADRQAEPAPTALRAKRMGSRHRLVHPLERELQQVDHRARTHRRRAARKRVESGGPEPLAQRGGSHRTTRRPAPHRGPERLHHDAGGGALEERRRTVLALRLRGPRSRAR
jgi:hypothetical protein